MKRRFNFDFMEPYCDEPSRYNSDGSLVTADEHEEYMSQMGFDLLDYALSDSEEY